MRWLFPTILLVLSLAAPKAATLETFRTKMDSLLRSERATWMELNKGRTDSVTATLDLRLRIDVLGKVVGIEVDSSQNMPSQFQTRLLSKIREIDFGQERGTHDLFTYSMFFQYQGAGSANPLGRDFWIRMGAVSLGIVTASLLLSALR